MENQHNKPFYLKGYKNNGKGLIIAGMFMAVLSLANLFLLITVPLLIGLGIRNIQRGKSELNVLLDSAISFYERKSYEECKYKLDKVLLLDHNSIKAVIILALVKYEQGEYGETIKLLNWVPEEKVKNELDLEMKLGDSYLKLKEYKKAEEIYVELIKLQPKSEYLKNALKECNSKV